MLTAPALVLILALIPVAVWVIKRANWNKSIPGYEMQLLASLQLGPRERICLVQVGDRRLVLGVTAHTINPLDSPTPLSAPKSPNAVNSVAAAGDGPTDTVQVQSLQTCFSHSLKSVISRLGGAALALLLMIATALWFAPDANAQQATSPILINSTSANGGTTYSVPIQTLLVFTALSFLPAMVLLMSSFTRIIIVMSLLRQAIGLQSTPPNQVLIGIALFMSFFVMGPTLDRIHAQAYKPFSENKISFEQALDAGAVPLRSFMLRQTRVSDINLFTRIAKADPNLSPQQLPMRILVPAFVTSELKTAFQIGFLVFVPFLIIDLIVASVLMSMGMMMLSPVLIALPFKLMLFVLADGWSMLMSSVVDSFGTS
jgi:flagellar biosynthesis protein FliP